MVREAWLLDSIQKRAAQPLDAYDVVSDLAPEGKGIPWDKQDAGEEALESLTAEVNTSHFLYCQKKNKESLFFYFYPLQSSCFNLAAASSVQVKLFGKRGVHKDSMLREQGGYIFEMDGIIYNCAFSICDQERGLNEYAATSYFAELWNTAGYCGLGHCASLILFRLLLWTDMQ